MPADDLGNNKLVLNKQQEDIPLNVSGIFNKSTFEKNLIASSCYDKYGPVAMISLAGEDKWNPLSLNVYSGVDRLSGKQSIRQNSLFYSMPITKEFLEYNLAVAALAKTLKESEPEVPFILHGNDHGTALAVSIMSCDNAMKTVYTMHNPLFESIAPRETLEAAGIYPALFGRRPEVNLNMLACNVAGFVTTVSSAYAAEMMDMSNGLYHDATYDRDFFTMLSSRKNEGTFLGISNGLPYRFLQRETSAFNGGERVPLNILWANRPAPEKSFHDFLAAVEMLASQKQNSWKRKLTVTMLFESLYNSGIDRDDLSLIEKLAHNRNIGFSSPTYSEAALLKAINDKNFATVGIMPSFIEPGGLFAGLLQAQGIPVIVNNSGGLKEVLSNGAIELNSGDNMAQRISSTILCLLEKESLSSLNIMNETAFRSARSLYDPERVAGELMEKVYKPLLGKQG
jgi:glycosyltransferase involved in cell wall biosynthesis